MDVNKDAIFSVCGKYRYAISRTWDAAKPYALFIGLNPSYADAELDDPTLKRCISFAQSWGFGGVRIANLFAYVCTDRFEMMRFPEPVGADNDKYLAELIAGAGIVVAAWGNEGRHLKRSAVVRAFLPVDTKCFKINATGEPMHPLYVHGDTKLIPFLMPDNAAVGC
ncbi:TPA: DUF1643 domain-containing protein [Escherichia coli]|uniref:DUF1643 domain-containing protein n=1 Tax=Phytobacter palmae TaxID=1855371 RepID=A0ABU9V314_9ENTR|nr:MULTISPECIES: DUF1643 domain-containing protein [Enterobacteriaceae]ELY2765995.1 DUF1643 domain-containing protein [Cronobacter malonaticus]GHM23349.1 hypothetical protein EBZU44_18930 [Enterobacter cloacae]HDT5868618.1 DUF1643 domain-containing protein [Enterobacter roggenkampii]EKC6206086.1 DUF1643 domain-containing protein [Cronobacter sakazakii]EKD3163127.1 DUF1643 domain-containing protein [Cronobacter sakazakii]